MSDDYSINITDEEQVSIELSDNGTDGWSPVITVQSDGDRRVLQITDWQGGEGSKPDTGDYVGVNGLESDIADGVDIRGASGADGSDGSDGADGASSYTYVAYASDDQGTGFSLTPSDSLDYIAVKTTDTEIQSPSAGDFTGLWVKFQANNGIDDTNAQTEKTELEKTDLIPGQESGGDVFAFSELSLLDSIYTKYRIDDLFNSEIGSQVSGSGGYDSKDGNQSRIELNTGTTSNSYALVRFKRLRAGYSSDALDVPLGKKAIHYFRIDMSNQDSNTELIARFQNYNEAIDITNYDAYGISIQGTRVFIYSRNTADGGTVEEFDTGFDVSSGAFDVKIIYVPDEKIQVFINGSSIGELTTNLPNANDELGSPLTIGISNHSSTNNFQASIYEAKYILER